MERETPLIARLGAPRPASRDHAVQRAASIVAHLATLLNTRAGSSLLDPSYGLPDLTDLARASAPSGVAIARIIAACVSRHEPRLHRVTVRAEHAPPDAPATLCFSLAAALADARPLRLAGRIGHGGQISLHQDG